LIEVAGRFGQPHLPVAPGGGFPDAGFSGAGFPGVGFPYLPCTMVTEEGVDPAFGDCARVGYGCVRAVLRGILWFAASLRDGGRGSGVIDGFLRSGGMGCDILSKARSSARGRGGVTRVAAHRMGCVVSAGGAGVGAMCEIGDRNLSSLYGGGYS